MTSRLPVVSKIASRLRRQEGGQALVMVVIGMLAIIGMAAFVIDVGSWYQVERQAQAAADAGATAAATDLPSNPSMAATDAQAYVNKNISGATTTTVTPYNSDSNQVQVTVTKSAPTFFAKIFGINSVTVTKSAVAKRVNGGSKWAVYANSTACGNSTLTDPGSSISINGGVRSNGGLSIPGSNNTWGPTSYGGPNNCTASISNQGNTFNGSSTPTSDTSTQTWPEAWFNSAPGAGVCDYSASSFSWSTDGTASNYKVIPSGTYCATSSISISGKYITCNCTFIAPTVAFPGSYLNLTAYYSDLLIDHYSSGSDFNIAGSNDQLTGTIYVPFRRLGISGSNGSLFNVLLEGNTVSISGSGWSLNGNGPSMGYQGSQLIQ
jgi:Flp pilus assembly protein TadG